MSFTWIILALPSLIARICIRKEKKLLGVLQDLFVGLQLEILPVYISPIVQLFILYDALTAKKFQFRLCWSTFSFLFKLGEFRDSIKAIGFYKWLIPYIILALFPAFFTPSPSLITLLGFPLLLISSSQSTDALVILWEKQLARGCLKPFRRTKGNFSLFVKKEVLSEGEVYTPVSPEYPLFRYTHGFKGEKIAPIEGDKKPHIIFLFFESLRAKELQCLGGRKETLPHLNSLIKESYFFPKYYSNSLLTFRAFFTSHYGLPYQLKMCSGLDDTLPVQGLPDLLKEAGYQTNYLTGAHFDIGGIGPFLKNRGADFIFDKKDFCKKYYEVSQGSWGVSDEYLFDTTLEHLEKNHQTPQFYSLLTITSHHPWIVPPSYQGPTFSDLKGEYTPKYLQTLCYTDRCIGAFIEELKKRGLSKEVVLFIMGDHGLHLGEDDRDYEYGRRNQIDNFHVPLIIHADGRIPDPKVIDTLGSQADLLPTCMDLLNLKGYQHSIGKSLLRKQKSPRVFFHAPVNFANTVCCMEKNGVFTNEEKHPQSVMLNAFRTMITNIFEYKKTLPPHLEKKIGHLKIEPFTPPLELSKMELTGALKQNSPFTALILNGHPALDDELLLQIAQWNPDLFEIHMNESYRITDQGIIQLIKQCHSLTHLEISDCPLLTKACLKKVPYTLSTLLVNGLDFINDTFFHKKMKFLEVLSIENTPITMSGLKKLATFTPNLLKLSLSYPNFTAEEICLAIASLPLWRLHIQACEALSDEEARHFFYPHPHLRFLTLNHCHNLTDALFDSLPTVTLKHLTLHDCPQLTDEGLEKILKLPLDSLHVSACPQLTERSHQLAKEHTSSFKELNIQFLNHIVFKP